LWGQGLETDLPQQNRPKLPSEDIFNQEMVDCFLLDSNLGKAFLLCATNHMKKRHFGGAQVFQILPHGAKRVAPKKKPSYAALAEYWPLEENLQICLSSLSGCRTSERISHNWRTSTITPTVIAPCMC
jgi:hypothetical protein